MLVCTANINKNDNRMGPYIRIS